jgi:hypothetical protein
LGGRNFCPPSLSDSDFSAAAEFRASETGAPPQILLFIKPLNQVQYTIFISQIQKVARAFFRKSVELS